MRVLTIGATGFLGGAIAVELEQAGHQVLALARDREKARLEIGGRFELIDGSLDVLGRVVARLADFDAVIQAADSDHTAGTATLLDALRGTAKTFVHISGISVTADRAEGRASDIVLDETTPFEPVADRARRFAIDQRVREEAGNGLRSMVVCCPLVYGAPTWSGRESVQLPFLVAHAKRHGVARYIGPGLARWSHAHVGDVARLVAAALGKGQPGALYYPENGEIAWRDIAELIGARVGVPAQSWTLAEAEADWGPRARISYSTNARTRGLAARRDLGWLPRIDALADDIDRLAAAAG